MTASGSAEQARVRTPGPLHASDGALAQVGWSPEPLLQYRRSAVKAPKRRVREWDRYWVCDDDFAVSLVLADLGVFGVASVSLVDFGQAAFLTKSIVMPLTLGRLHLPEAATSGTAQLQNGRLSLRFEARGGSRTLRARFACFDGDDDLSFDAVLDDGCDAMTLSAPWAGDQLAFCYSHKAAGLPARGSFKKGLMVHGFKPSDSFGLFDWGRAVCPRDTTRLWAAAQGWQDGYGGSEAGSCVFALSLGYGLGNTTAATENAVFVDGRMCKLGQVGFDIPPAAGGEGAVKLASRYNLLQPWRIQDDAGCLDLMFTPGFDCAEVRDLKLATSDCHRVFGLFDGTVTLDDGAFTIRGLRGFVELARLVL